VLQSVAVCSIVLQCVAVCCSVVQCVAVCSSALQHVDALQCVAKQQHWQGIPTTRASDVV